MNAFAALVHAASGLIFGLGILLMLTGGEVGNIHVAGTVALLGLNACVYWFRRTLAEGAAETEREYERKHDVNLAPSARTAALMAAEERARAANSPSVEWKDD